MKTLLATIAVSAIVATTGAISAGGASARDLAKEFREGWNPTGQNYETLVDSFRTGFNPTSQRSVEDILRDKARDGFAKPDSFATGVDLGGI